MDTFTIKLKRNESCYCGSGKKYKQCCIDKEKKFKITSFEITDEPMSEINPPSQLSNKDKETLDDLLEKYHSDEITDFKKELITLNKLKEKYPEERRIYNYIGTFYGAIGKKRKAEKIVKETYEKFPDYLFGRINYAMICLDKAKYEEVSQILEGKYDLQSLYPDRSKFHISEVMAFFLVCGKYFAAKGEIEAAEKYFEMIQEIGPESSHLEDLEKDISFWKPFWKMKKKIHSFFNKQKQRFFGK